MIVGVLGGGQLARMLALAGRPLGVDVIFIDPAADACAGDMAEHLHGAFDDPALLEQLASRADVITYEFENVPPDSVRFLAERKPVYPSPEALATGRDRKYEKELFRDLQIPTAEFRIIDSLDGLGKAVGEIGLPALLKTRREGYDGKGQVMLRSVDQLEAAWQAINGVPAIVERIVSFEREVSIVAARNHQGGIHFYPLSENTHRDGILRLSIKRLNDPRQAQAEELAGRLLERLDYVGVLALELFDTGDSLLANEFAPRVHNSGHWSIEGAETSQFENHLRAVLEWPLGDTVAAGEAAMVNFIGQMPNAVDVLAIPGAHLHDYGKKPRAGRKVGHATLRAADAAQLAERVRALEALADG